MESMIQTLGVTLADLLPLDRDARVFTLDNTRYAISQRLADRIHAVANERMVQFHTVVRELMTEIHAPQETPVKPWDILMAEYYAEPGNRRVLPVGYFEQREIQAWRAWYKAQQSPQDATGSTNGAQDGPG
jgi:hypothetical protein